MLMLQIVGGILAAIFILGLLGVWSQQAGENARMRDWERRNRRLSPRQARKAHKADGDTETSMVIEGRAWPKTLVQRMSFFDTCPDENYRNGMIRSVEHPEVHFSGVRNGYGKWQAYLTTVDRSLPDAFGNPQRTVSPLGAAATFAECFTTAMARREPELARVRATNDRLRAERRAAADTEEQAYLQAVRA